MHLVELRQMARDAGVSRVNDMVSNTELIRAIQRASQGHACYLTDERYTCRSPDCEWKRDCMKLVAVWAR